MSHNNTINSDQSIAGNSQNHFILLLIMLFLFMSTIAVFRMIAPDARPGFRQLIFSVLFSGMILSAVFAVSKHRKTAIIAVSLLVPVFLLQAIHLIIELKVIEIAKNAFGIAFLGYIVALILKHLFDSKKVTLDTVCASLCIYLLLGVLWALLYSLIDLLEPGSFTFNLADETEIGEIRFGGNKSIYAIYYSFVTMTTLGYGDIVPASAPARMFAAMQALMGQLYLAVLVARFVGLHISHTQNEKKD